MFHIVQPSQCVNFFFFNDTATTEIYTLSLHDALPISSGETLATTRSFFGVNRVRLMEAGAVRILQHGTTAHGVESTRPGEAATPLGYYHREGPFGRFFAALEGRGASSALYTSRGRVGPLLGGAGGARRGAERRRRAGRRQPRLLRPARSVLDLSRDRPGGRKPGARSAGLPFAGG